MLKNGLLFGSFNPLHLSHIDLIGKALGYFEMLHIFARYTEGVDMVDWQTKKKWLERVNEQFDDRLRIYKMEMLMKDKQYGNLDLTAEFLKYEKQTGVTLDGLVCGEDMQYMVDVLKASLPEKTFIVLPRDPRSSSSIRGSIDAMRPDMPDYVYKDLKERGY